MIITVKNYHETLFEVVLSCQSSNLNQLQLFYIYHKNEKGKPWKKDLPLWKNDITNILDHLSL
jgi:hypothetical protein